MRFYGPINNLQELQDLQKKASEHECIAVGVTPSGAAYKFDETKNMSITLKPEEIEVILDLSESQVEELINSRGKVDFEETQEVEDDPSEEGKEEVPFEDPVIEDKDDATFQEEDIQSDHIQREEFEHDEEPEKDIEADVEEPQVDPRVLELEEENQTLRDEIADYDRIIELIKEAIAAKII